MSSRQPPALASWLLDHLGYTGRNPALAGDLLEEFRSGRSPAWYWRQTLMVIVTGIGGNAFVLQRYLTACIVGFAAQAAVAFCLWRIDAPPRIHSVVWAILASLLVLIVSLLRASIKSWITGGPAAADLRPLLCSGAGGAQNRRTIMAFVAFEEFTLYLSGYCLCALFLPHWSLGDLASAEVTWLVLFLLAPALAPVPEANKTRESPRVYPRHELGLLVARADGKTILLRPETVAESVFAAADEELAAALFERAASLEFLRRAIWLGSARKDLAMMKDPPETRPISLADLISLLDEIARTKSVERSFYVEFPASH
jgi:hypothetical protein